MKNIELLKELNNLEENFKEKYLSARKEAQLKYLSEQNVALQEVQILDKMLSLMSENEELHKIHEFNEIYVMAADMLYFENKLIAAS